MKIGYSDSVPNLIRVKGNKIRIYYDIEEVEKKLDGKTQIQYKFIYTDISLSPTRGEIIDAIISNKYSKDTELALINNELASSGTIEYKEYQDYRIHAKGIADLVIKEL